MVLTASSMLPLGTKAPEFTLPDAVSGKPVSLSEVKPSKALVIMFICNHCPYVVHIMDQLVKITNEYKAKGIDFIAISANDVNDYPQDAPDKMQILAQEKGFCFPYLYDESQIVAKAFHAECTPDFYIFDRELRCQYRGRFDESSPGKKDVPVTGADLTSALDNLIAGKSIDVNQFPSMGCNIKWKS